MKSNLQGKAYLTLYDLTASDLSILSPQNGPSLRRLRKTPWNLQAFSYLPLPESPPGKLSHGLGSQLMTPSSLLSRGDVHSPSRLPPSPRSHPPPSLEATSRVFQTQDFACCLPSKRCVYGYRLLGLSFLLLKNSAQHLKMLCWSKQIKRGGRLGGSVG